jgi:hypothetical protein
MSKIQDLVIRLNNGDWPEFSQIFGGDVDRFLSTVKRYGLLDSIDLTNVDYHDPELVNPIMLIMLENDPSYINTIVKEFLPDVEVKSDGYYLRLRDLEELSEFFKDNTYSREYNDRDVVKNVLGEDWWEPYSDTVHDVYDDIIKELTDKNKNLLAERIIELVGNQELSLEDYNTPLFEDMSDKDGRFIITESNVMDIIDDEDSMMSLLNGELNELKSQLYWLGDEAYNNAYNDMVYGEVFHELSTYFEGRHDWVSVKRGEKTIYTPYIKIKNLYADVLNFLNAYKKYSENLFYYNDYTSMVKQYLEDEDEWLRLRLPDYPDNRKVVEYINDGFPDRLY